jgi:hypothetical protein
VSLTAQPRAPKEFSVELDPASFSCFETWVAAKVIVTAIHDYVANRPTHKTCVHKWNSNRTDAERFLFGEGLVLWCSVLDWEPSCILERVRRLQMRKAARPSVNTEMCATVSIRG